MKRLAPIKVASTESHISQSAHRGNIIKDNPRILAIVGTLALVSGVILGAVQYLDTDSESTIGVHTTLAECKKDKQDTLPQPVEYLTGQRFSIGLDGTSLENAVKLKMTEGGIIEQEEIAKGVEVLTQTVPAKLGQDSSALELKYKLDNSNTVTVTAYPGEGSNPLLTPVKFIRLC